MNKQQIKAIFSLRQLRPILVETRLTTATIDSLVTATYDRAILLTEIAGGVLTNHLNVPDAELNIVTRINAVIIEECEGEMSTTGRHLPVVVPRDPSASPHANVSALRPSTWSWLELLAAGVPLTSQQLAVALHVIFDEDAYLSETNWNFNSTAGGLKLTTFAERCHQSGCGQFIPSAIMSTSPTATHQRYSRGRPLKRMREGQEQRSMVSNGAWRFVGHIEEEVAIRTRLATVAGSWKSLQSELRAWGALMDAYHPGVPHYPATFARLAAFVSFFDNSASGRKYVHAVQKASNLMGKEWPPEKDVSALLRGAAKFQTPGTKSYLVGTDTGVIVTELFRQGHVELAKLVAVCYTYQLRAQSECFPLQSGVRHRDLNDNDWHSDVIITESSVTIALRRRKNTGVPSEIKRHCICKVWQPRECFICGPCVLRGLIRERSGRCGRLFQHVKPSDIDLIKTIAHKRGLGHATWHGFRRGRTMDVVAGLDIKNNPAASLNALFDSGGWRHGSRAVFQYITPEAASVQRVARHLADNSGSE